MFNAKEETRKIIKFIKDYYKDNNLGGIVLGISGGKDSIYKSSWERECFRCNYAMSF